MAALSLLCHNTIHAPLQPHDPLFTAAACSTAATRLLSIAQSLLFTEGSAVLPPQRITKRKGKTSLPPQHNKYSSIQYKSLCGSSKGLGLGCVIHLALCVASEEDKQQCVVNVWRVHSRRLIRPLSPLSRSRTVHFSPLWQEHGRLVV